VKLKTSELQGAALDWAVALIEYPEWKEQGFLAVFPHDLSFDDGTTYAPTTDWAQGGPIIEREGLEVVRGNALYFPKGNENGEFYEPLWIAGKMHGQTPLIAAMRCYVASKLGDEVEVPDESST
jgi:hypothetical protein